MEKNRKIKVVHIDSGLGNQMLSYCEYLAAKKSNPDADCFIETLVYDITASHVFINQWNGYELDKVFNISASNVSELFTDAEWGEIINEAEQTRFWEHNWNYPVYFTSVFNSHGLQLKNIRGNFDNPILLKSNRDTTKGIRSTFLWCYLKHLKQVLLQRKLKYSLADYDNLFHQSCDNVFTGQRLTMKFWGSGIEQIEDEIRASFVFPQLKNADNVSILKRIQASESVAMHIRRGDMLNANFYCYKNGYFKRAVNYIRSHVFSPVFFIFCDPQTIEWARDNGKIIGLDFAKDQYVFVDWNKEADSWADMYLMSQCKHNIFTGSSFGWWGAWLNTNKDKITCSPDCRTIATNFF